MVDDYLIETSLRHEIILMISSGAGSVVVSISAGLASTSTNSRPGGGRLMRRLTRIRMKLNILSYV